MQICTLEIEEIELEYNIIYTKFRSLYVSTYFVSLPIARLVWLSGNMASCCAHFRHSPATRGAPSALSASATWFSFCLSCSFTSSHSFWLTDRSFLKMASNRWVRDQEREKRVVYRWILLCPQTWGTWREPPRFQSGRGGLLSIVADEHNFF